MSKILAVEFWLFAIPAVAVIAAVFAGAGIIGRAIPYLAAVWLILAIAWMFKVIFRRARD